MGSMVVERQPRLESISNTVVVVGHEVRCRDGQPCQPAFYSKVGGGGEVGNRTGAGWADGCVKGVVSSVRAVPVNK